MQHVETLSDGQSFKVGPLVITAHLTAGHTPGGTSWTWRSCEGDHCANLVYADSLTAVSADGFKFTGNAAYPNAVQDFEKSFSFLRSTPCDILLTPHPETSDLWGRLEAREKGVKPNAMVDPSACRNLADGSKESFRKRVAEESVRK